MTSPTTTPDQPDESATPSGGGQTAPASLSQTASRGIALQMVLTVGTKSMGFITQILLARLLAPEEFGVYFAAIAVSNMIFMFRDAGLREILVKRGAEEYPQIVGSVYWLALVVNLTAAVVLAAIAPAAASFYNMPDLRNVLWVLAIALPMGTLSTVLYSKIRIDLKFPALARILFFQALVRYVGTVVLAVMGFGPLSFVIPVIAMSIYENIATYRVVRDKPWQKPARPDLWPGFLSQGKWLIVGALASMMLDQGDYFVAARFVSDETLGLYGFGNQMQLQSAYVMLSFATSMVLFPVLARLVNEPARHSAAAARFLRVLMLLAAPACLGLGVVFDPMQEFLLQNKWGATVAPMLVLSLMFPFRCTIGLTTAVLLSQGRFKRWAGLTIVEGALLMVGALIGAKFWGTPVAIAAGVATALGLSRIAVTSWILGAGGTPVRETLAALLAPYLVGVTSAALAVFVVDPALPEMPAWARFLVLGAVFTAIYGVGARLLLSRQIRDGIAVAPARLGPLLHRVLLLRQHGR